MVLLTMIARITDGLPLAATMQEDEQSGKNILEYQNQAKMLFRRFTAQSPTRLTIETGPYLFHEVINMAYDICRLEKAQPPMSSSIDPTMSIQCEGPAEYVGLATICEAGTRVEAETQEKFTCMYNAINMACDKRRLQKKPSHQCLLQLAQPCPFKAEKKAWVVQSPLCYLIEHEVCYLVLAERNYSKRLAYSYLEDLAQEFHSQYGKKVNSVTRPYSFIEFDTYIQKAKKVFTDSRARRNLSNLNTELQDVQRIMVQNIDDVMQRGVILSELDTKAQNLSMLSQVYKKDATNLNTKSLYVKAALGFCILFVFVLYFWIL